MHTISPNHSWNNEIHVILHLSEDPIALQKKRVHINEAQFTTKEATQKIHSQQQRVIDTIRQKNISFKLVHTYENVLNAITLIVRKKDIHKLSVIPDVLFVEESIEVQASSLSSTEKKQTNEEVDVVHEEIKALWTEGIEGQHIKVAVIDSGIDKNHPDLKDVYKGGTNLIDQSDREKYCQSRAMNDASETSPYERPESLPAKMPTYGNPYETYHGTHISGIIAGNNANGVKGVAPKIDLYAFRVLGAYSSSDVATIINGIEAAVEQNMDIINLSLSDDSDSEIHALSIAVNNAVQSGIVVVSTAGNTGSVRGSVRAPGTSRLGISVGNSTLSDEVDASSSRGPSQPNFDIKPDIVAPGTNVLSTMPRFHVDSTSQEYSDAYKRETGTSQAAPYITGLVALMKQAHPDWTPCDMKVSLTNTAKVLNVESYSVFDQGAGRVQPYAAVHPSILAYTTEVIDINGKGKMVEHKKGSITFGNVSLQKPVSITKTVIVQDITGKGGTYEVDIQVTDPFEHANITVDTHSFSLQGECELHVTLTATEHKQPKYRDEILGYVHIHNEDQSIAISLPFAADFSDGATVTPEIEEFTIPTKDISFAHEQMDEEIHVTLSNNSDLSYPSLEITNYVTKEPVDSLFYDNGLSLGTRKFPILREYTSAWTNESTILEDGLYSIDFSGMSKESQLTGSIGPIFITSTKPEIIASIQGVDVFGQVKDDYIHFHQNLIELNEEFDINEKISFSLCVTRDRKSEDPIPVCLHQDGTFSFTLDDPLNENDCVTLMVKDAAGNWCEETLE